jgi:hypothetical protein
MYLYPPSIFSIKYIPIKICVFRSENSPGPVAVVAAISHMPQLETLVLWGVLKDEKGVWEGVAE